MKAILAAVVGFLLCHPLSAESIWELLKRGKHEHIRITDKFPLSTEKLNEAKRFDAILQQALTKPPSPIPVATFDPLTYKLALYFVAQRHLALHKLPNDPEASLLHIKRAFKFAKTIRDSEPSLADLMIMSAFESKLIHAYLIQLEKHPNRTKLLNQFLPLAQASVPAELTREDLKGEMKASLFMLETSLNGSKNMESFSWTSPKSIN